MPRSTPPQVATVIVFVTEGKYFMFDPSSPSISPTTPGHCEPVVGERRQGDVLSDAQIE
jgi:hypothetical protein